MQEKISIAEEKIVDAQDRLKKTENNLKKITYESQMMRTFMLDLLDLAQMESQSLKINKDYFSLNEIIDQAFMMLSYVSSMKKITFEKKVDAEKERCFKQIFGDDRRYL